MRNATNRSVPRKNRWLVETMDCRLLLAKAGNKAQKVNAEGTPETRAYNRHEEAVQNCPKQRSGCGCESFFHIGGTWTDTPMEHPPKVYTTPLHTRRGALTHHTCAEVGKPRTPTSEPEATARAAAQLMRHQSCRNYNIQKLIKFSLQGKIKTTKTRPSSPPRLPC